jgi:hypothetical protein
VESVNPERHYTVPEVARMWSLSRETVRRILADVPGVIRQMGTGKTRQVHWRIPASVLAQVRIEHPEFAWLADERNSIWLKKQHLLAKAGKGRR